MGTRTTAPNLSAAAVQIRTCRSVQSLAHLPGHDDLGRLIGGAAL
jgi:hypothetical protein